MNWEDMKNLGFEVEDFMDGVFNELHGINDRKQIKYERMIEIVESEDEKMVWNEKLSRLKIMREYIEDYVRYIKINFVEPLEQYKKMRSEMKK